MITMGGQQRAGNTISQVQQCPTFDVGHQQDILLADGSERELSIRVKNMPQFKVSSRPPFPIPIPLSLAAGRDVAQSAKRIDHHLSESRARRPRVAQNPTGPCLGASGS